MSVRAATTEDAPAIAAVHVESWRWSYAGLMPQAELDALDVEKRAASWRTILSTPHGTLVVEDELGICGFASIGPCRDDDQHGEGELYAIYLAERAAGRGIGRTLHEEALAALRRAGYRDATLWVLRNNARARKFYEREGWTNDGREKVEMGRAGNEPQLRYRQEL